MVIEHAERFGLAQLHQLRGRIGRGSGASTCLLLYKAPLGVTAKARLAILRETEDGFRIAEEDLRLRGEGDVLGTRQSGLPAFQIARPEVHGKYLGAARDDAALILSRDATLTTPRGEALRQLLYHIWQGRGDQVDPGGLRGQPQPTLPSPLCAWPEPVPLLQWQRAKPASSAPRHPAAPCRQKSRASSRSRP